MVYPDSKGSATTSRSTNKTKKGSATNENRPKRPLDTDEEVIGQLRDKSNVTEILSKVKVSHTKKL